MTWLIKIFGGTAGRWLAAGLAATAVTAVVVTLFAGYTQMLISSVDYAWKTAIQKVETDRTTDRHRVELFVKDLNSSRLNAEQEIDRTWAD